MSVSIQMNHLKEGNGFHVVVGDDERKEGDVVRQPAVLATHTFLVRDGQRIPVATSLVLPKVQVIAPVNGDEGQEPEPSCCRKAVTCVTDFFKCCGACIYLICARACN